MNKSILLSVVGTIGTVVANALGGWDAAMQTLLIFMAIDYISGLTLAGVFKLSPKSAGGALESKAGFRGLIKKGMILLLVLVATQLDIILDQGSLIRTGAIIAFCANEVISIVENSGLMGVPIPKILKEAIELLRTKE